MPNPAYELLSISTTTNKTVLLSPKSPRPRRDANNKTKTTRLRILTAHSATPFDVIISYETVEHLSDYRLFLKNIDQNLAEDGTFIISTPISKNTTIKPNHNPYHEIEWTYSDFTKLLQEYFILKDTFIQNAVIEGNYPEYTLTNRIKNRLGKKITKSDSQFFEGIKAAHELKVNELDAGYIIAVLNKK